MIKRFDVTVEVEAPDPEIAIERAEDELTDWNATTLSYFLHRYSRIDYGIRTLNNDEYSVYLSYKVKEE